MTGSNTIKNQVAPWATSSECARYANHPNGDLRMTQSGNVLHCRVTPGPVHTLGNDTLKLLVKGLMTFAQLSGNATLRITHNNSLEELSSQNESDTQGLTTHADGLSDHVRGNQNSLLILMLVLTPCTVVFAVCLKTVHISSQLEFVLQKHLKSEKLETTNKIIKQVARRHALGYFVRGIDQFYRADFSTSPLRRSFLQKLQSEVKKAVERAEPYSQLELGV